MTTKDQHGVDTAVFASDVVRGWSALGHLTHCWQGIYESCINGTHGLDATCSPHWAQALQESILRDADIRTLVVRLNNEPVALIPVYVNPRQSMISGGKQLNSILMAYSGRSSLLVKDDDQATLEYVLQHLGELLGDWATFEFALVEGSRLDRALSSIGRARRIRVVQLSVEESPYLLLPSTWSELERTLPKKLRWTIGKAERTLAGRGRLSYEHVSSPASAERVIATIYDIELRSWKESAKSSITASTEQKSFYEAFVPIAATAGMLSTHVLRLDDQPIAYILGMSAGDCVFLDLKESFDAEFSDCSPGHLLKKFAMQTLIGSGIKIFDFMGLSEPYKLKWTKLTYRRRKLAVYSQSLTGRMSHIRARLGGVLRRSFGSRDQ